MRLRTMALALALACGLIGLAEAKKSGVVYPGKNPQKVKMKNGRPVFKKSSKNKAPKFKPGKAPKNKHR